MLVIASGIAFKYFFRRIHGTSRVCHGSVDEPGSAATQGMTKMLTLFCIALVFNSRLSMRHHAMTLYICQVHGNMRISNRGTTIIYLIQCYTVSKLNWR